SEERYVNYRVQPDSVEIPRIQRPLFPYPDVARICDGISLLRSQIPGPVKCRVFHRITVCAPRRAQRRIVETVGPARMQEEDIHPTVPAMQIVGRRKQTAQYWRMRPNPVFYADV